MPHEISNVQHIKDILKKSGPLILMQGTDIISNFIRVYLISQAIGESGLTASTIMYSITTFIVYPIPLLTAQDAVFIGEKFGKAKLILAEEQTNNQPNIEEKALIESSPIPSQNSDDLYNQIGSFVRQGWLLAFCASVPSTLILITLNSQFISLFAQPQEIENLAQTYFIPFALSLPAQFMLKISERFMSAVDQEKWIIPYRLLSLGIETALNFLLIPSYSLAGAAYAQLIKNTLALIGLSIFFSVKSEFKKFNIFHKGLGDLNYVKKILVQGWPMMTTQFLIVGNSFTVSTFVGKYGPSRLAAEQIMIQYFGLLTTISSGISESANRIVAQYFGAERFNEMKRAGNLSLISNIVIYGSIAGIYNIFSIPLAGLFVSDKQTLASMEELIRYNFIIMTLANLMNVIHDNCRANLTAVSDTMLISFIPLIVGLGLVLPLSAMSTYVFDFDLYGITSSILIGTLVGTSVVTQYWAKHSERIVDTNNRQAQTSNERLTYFFCNKTIRNNNSSNGEVIKNQSPLDSHTRHRHNKLPWSGIRVENSPHSVLENPSNDSEDHSLLSKP